MESKDDRRNFLRFVGIASVTGFANGCGSQSSAQDNSGAPKTTQTLDHTFLVDPGVTHEIESASGEVVRESFWTVPKEMEIALPMLTRSFVPNLRDVQDFADNTALGQTPLVIARGVAADPFTALMGTALSGVPNVMHIAGNAGLAVVDRADLDLSLAFFHSAIGQSFAPFTCSTDVMLGLPVQKIEKQARLLTNAPPPGITLYGWKLQFRGPDKPHPLGTCVSTPVTHFNVDVHHQEPNGSFTPVLNFHLGTYRDGSRRCFVLWENIQLNVCWRICSPTQQDLVQMAKYMLVAAAALAAVAIAGWIIAAIAEAVALASYIPLLLLV